MKSHPLIFCAILIVSGLCCSAPTTATEPQPLNLGVAEAVETALQQNLGLQLKQEDVGIAEGISESAAGTFDTQLEADVGASSESIANPPDIITGSEERTAALNARAQKRFHTGTEVELNWNNGNLDTNSDVFLFDPVYNTKASIGLTQPLLRGLGVEVQTADLEASKRQLEAASFLVDAEAADLAAAVKSAYWELVFAHQNLEVLKLSLRLAEQLRDETAARIEAGKLADIDLFQPESQVAQREQELISGERAIGVAEDELKFLLNSENWLIPLKPVELPDTKPIDPIIETVYDNAITSRPDLKAAQLQIRASELQLRKAENDILPALDLVGSAGFGGTADSYSDAVDNSFNDSDTQWQVGLRISRPLDNSFARGKYRQAQAELSRNQTNSELLKLNIKRTVKVVVRDIELALKAIEATRKTALANKKRLEAEQIKFDAGRSTTLDVLIAQEDYSSALSAENRSKVVYAQTRAELDRIQGLITFAK